MQSPLNPTKFFLCTDGSNQAKQSFFQVIEFMNKEDSITVAHISDDRNTDLAEEYKPENIMDFYKTECISRFIESKYDLFLAEKDLSQFQCKPIIGYHGRKGQKLDATLMGQTIHHTIYNSKVPVLVLKELVKRTDQEPHGFNFLILVDGSLKSYRALKFVQKLIKKEEDQVFVLTCQSGTKLSEIKKEFKQAQLENAPAPCQLIQFNQAKIYDKATTIIDYVNQNESISFDFVIFGNNGLRAQEENKHYIGRLAELILTKVKSNPIMII